MEESTSSGSGSGLPRQEVGISTPAPVADRPASKIPGFLRGPIVASSKTAARVRPAAWMAYDVVVAGAALTLGYTMSPSAKALAPPATGLIVFALATVIGGNICGLYERLTLLSRIRMFLSLCLTVAFAAAALSFLSYVTAYQQIGRWVLLITFFTFLLAAGIPRLAAGFASHLYKIRVLLVGDKETASSVAERLSGGEGHHLLVGFCGDNGGEDSVVLGQVGEIPSVCKDLRVDEVVTTRGYMERPGLLDTCFQAVRETGCRVLDEASFSEEVFEQVPVDDISERWFYTAKFGGASPFNIAVKRSMNVAVATAGLLLTAPLFLVIWALVRLTSRGPAIYAQIRCGRYGRPFRIYKFRTMAVDAEPNGAQWAQKHDSRITPVGRFLRKTRLDEIPQFWNIFKGDMSFVGPRPERPELIGSIEGSVPYFAFRNLVRPGLTGLAQIRFQYGSSVEDARQKLQYDLYYIKNWSLLLDLQIILRTISAIMKGSR